MKKLLTVTLLASMVTFSLFVFMAYLINNNNVKITTPLPPVFVEVNTNKPDTPPKPKRSVLPEPPKVKVPVPKLLTEINNNEGTLVGEIEVNIKAPTTQTGLNGMNFTPDHDARPIVRVSPKYPMGAAREGIEGWVRLAFEINSLGEVVNISIIDAKPKRVFDRAATKALKKWKYKAKQQNGEYVHQINQMVQLDFTMNQNI